MSAQRAPWPTPWECWRGTPITGWQAAVEQLASGCRPAWLSAAHPTIAPLVAEVRQLDSRLGLKLEAALNAVTTDTAGWAGLFGYGLAQTWPGSLAELGDWPARAAAFAGLDDDGEGDDAG